MAGLLPRERALAALDAGQRQHLADLMRILLAPFELTYLALGSLGV